MYHPIFDHNNTRGATGRSVIKGEGSSFKVKLEKMGVFFCFFLFNRKIPIFLQKGRAGGRGGGGQTTLSTPLYLEVARPGTITSSHRNVGSL